MNIFGQYNWLEYGADKPYIYDMDKNNNNKTELNKNDKSKAKKIAAASLAVATIGAAAAADMPPSYEDITARTAIVQDIADFDMDMPGDEINDQDEERQKKRVTIGSVLMAPIYFAGLGILKLIEFLLAGVASPLLAMLLRWVFLALLAVGVLAAGLKYAFPDIPLRELLSPQRALVAVGGVTAISIICQILPIFGVAAAVWAERIQAIGVAILIAAIAFFVIKIRKRRKSAA